MDKAEIEEILSRTRLPAPAEIFMLPESIVGNYQGRRARFAGLATARTAILSVEAQPEHVLHEGIHTTGVHLEPIAYLGSWILERKMRSALSVYRRDVHYAYCPGCPVCKEFAARGHPVKHLVLRG